MNTSALFSSGRHRVLVLCLHDFYICILFFHSFSKLEEQTLH